jgi:NTP pyrophosphatase (non-canonical NTP hydrolase)
MKKENLKNHSKDLNSDMTQVIDTNKYIEFVRQTTSPASSDFAQLLTRLTELEANNDADVPRLLTAALGMSAEAGEFTEVVKKIILQGKPYNEENIFHMKRELGDQLWYIAQACMALDTTIEEILKMNYEKLSARYPEGTFDVYRSENRVEGDL